MPNDIIGIKIYRKKEELDIRGENFRHGQEVYPETVLWIRDVRLRGVVQEYKAYQNIKDTHQGITNVVADKFVRQSGLPLAQDVIQADEYRKGNSRFLGK